MVESSKVSSTPVEIFEIKVSDGIVGFAISSKENQKHYQHIPYQGTETRCLLAILERMFPDKGGVYF